MLSPSHHAAPSWTPFLPSFPSLPSPHPCSPTLQRCLCTSASAGSAKRPWRFARTLGDYLQCPPSPGHSSSCSQCSCLLLFSSSWVQPVCDAACELFGAPRLGRSSPAVPPRLQMSALLPPQCQRRCSSRARREGCPAGHRPVLQDGRMNCTSLALFPPPPCQQHQPGGTLSRAVTMWVGSGSTKGLAARMDLPTMLPPRSLRAQAVPCFLQPWAEGRKVATQGCRGDSAPQCVWRDPHAQEPQSRGCSVLHRPWACFMGWLWVEASSGLGCAWGEMCYWNNTPQRMFQRHSPLPEEKFQHVSLRSLCRPLHPEFAALGGSSSVSFGLHLCQQGTAKPASWRGRCQQTSGALSCLISFSVSSQVLAVFTMFCGIKYPPGKAKLSTSSWAPLLSQQFASHHSYVQLGIFPPLASPFHLTVLIIVQTYLFPLSCVPDERFPGP